MSGEVATSVDWLFLAIYILLTLVFIFQAYINFARKELSKFSYDALSLFFATAFGGKQSRQRARVLSKDPKRIRRFGVFALLGTAGGIYEIVNWIIRFYSK